MRLKSARVFDTSPQLPQRTEFGNGEELILVGGKAEIDEAPLIIERDAAGLYGAKISHADGEREGKLLGLGATGCMHDSSVGNREGTGEALAGEVADQPGKDRRDVLPRNRALATRSNSAERAEAEAYRHIFGRDVSGFDQCRNDPRGIFG